MERRLKERLTGAAVLILLAVIFVPMLLDNSVQDEIRLTESNIPPRPAPISNPMPIPMQPPVTTTNIVPSEPVQEQSSSNADTTQNPNTEQEPLDQVPLDIIGIPETEIIAQPSPTRAVPPPTMAQPPQAAAPDTETTGLTAWVVQLGSFSSQENASGLVQQLRKEGYPAFLEQLDSSNGVVYRVRVGPEVLRADADKVLEALRGKLKLEGIVLRYP